MRRLSQVVTTVTSVAVVTLAAGCGSDNPAPSAAPSRTPATPSSAVPQPPDAPASIEKKTKRGALDAVRHFLRSMEYAGDTGEVRIFRDSFNDTCTKCAAIADGIERTYAAGGSIRGGAWEPRRIKFYGIQGDVATIDVIVDYTPQTYVPERGGDVDKVPGQESVLKAFQVTWDNTWRVGALDPEA